MTLTGHLKDLNSPVTHHLNRVFGNVKAARQRANLEAPKRSVVLDGHRHDVTGVERFTPGPTRVRPNFSPNDIRHYDWTLCGTAFDYRLRLLLAPQHADHLVAALAIVRLSSLRGDDAPHRWWDAVRSAVNDMQSGPAPVTRAVSVTPGVELDVSRLCGLLALFEQAYRAPIGYQLDHLLATSPEFYTLNDLLGLVDPRLVDDVAALAAKTGDSQRPWLSASSVISNPTFDASVLLGGADADLIVDGTLIDIKTTRDPALKKSAIHQVLGYLLADTHDRYQIRKVGWYFSRQGYLWDVPVSEFLRALHGDEVDLAEARENFAAMLRARRAVQRQ